MDAEAGKETMKYVEGVTVDPSICLKNLYLNELSMGTSMAPSRLFRSRGPSSSVVKTARAPSKGAPEVYKIAGVRQILYSVAYSRFSVGEREHSVLDEHETTALSALEASQVAKSNGALDTSDALAVKDFTMKNVLVLTVSMLTGRENVYLKVLSTGIPVPPSRRFTPKGSGVSIGIVGGAVPPHPTCTIDMSASAMSKNMALVFHGLIQV
jgi:hypothetical protein